MFMLFKKEDVITLLTVSQMGACLLDWDYILAPLSSLKL